MGFDDVLLAGLILLAAILYASVGHGGASAYLAVMALMGLSPEIMRPAALLLNVLVSSIALWKFYRADVFSWQLFWPFAVASVPMAFIGGLVVLPAMYYKPVVGLVLLFAAWRMLVENRQQISANRQWPLAVLLIAGAGLGFLAGLTGVGGGIFLSPLLLLCGLASIKVVSGTAAAFVLVNSLAGLAGVMLSAPQWSPALPLWGVAAIMGGLVGAELGSRRLNNPALRKLLAVVLLIAGGKLLFGV